LLKAEGVSPDRKYAKLIIKTSDTDVIVLCIYFDKQMTNTSELWVQMGNASSVKDGQKSFASSHHNINKLRGKLATGRDASLRIIWVSASS
jgi:hypothetical protein